MKTEPLTVELADRAYPIYFESDFTALKSCVASLREAGRAVRVVSDAQVLEAHSHYLGNAGFIDSEILTLPPGEPSKSPEHFTQVLRFLAGQGCHRDCAVFAFGGGVIGDLAGFAAASYLRGVDFYQIPSTLLSMVDSSVGGKTGINLPEGKNLVGAFWQPQGVFVDTRLLQTLPPREFAAGMAEVIKYGLLADITFLETLERYAGLQADSPELGPVVRRCCAIKAEIVAADEKETRDSGGRALLNLGHTFAHAIENVAGYGAYLHGEAVAIGLVLATRLSVALGQLSADSVPRVEALLSAYQLPTRLRAELPLPQLMAAMQRDKKNRGGQLRFVTMSTLGQAITTEGIAPEQIQTIWRSARDG